jgi:protein translocase SecG subunit
MTILITFLTFILVLNCIFLMLLVLIQLPKKEAGSGLAFGGGATDALFGAGSGNALTQLTKYTAGFFLGLSLLLAVLNSMRAQHDPVRQELQRRAVPAQTVPAPGAPTAPESELMRPPMQPAPAQE